MTREVLIDHVAERLDVFVAVVTSKKLFDARNTVSTEQKIVAQCTYDTILREHAARLVDAVQVLGNEEPLVRS
jgi:hypothetical protein